MRDAKLFSGAAILSDGRVGLILNVNELGALYEHDRRATGVLLDPLAAPQAPLLPSDNPSAGRLTV